MSDSKFPAASIVWLHYRHLFRTTEELRDRAKSVWRYFSVIADSSQSRATLIPESAQPSGDLKRTYDVEMGQVLECLSKCLTAAERMRDEARLCLPPSATSPPPIE